VLSALVLALAQGGEWVLVELVQRPSLAPAQALPRELEPVSVLALAEEVVAVVGLEVVRLRELRVEVSVLQQGWVEARVSVLGMGKGCRVSRLGLQERLVG